uniref:Uncharacterized protein n=1 Tax=Aegilops tauschii subsp. strangulata TaxID=200361 RepID=A0A453QYY3_AEGTS
MYRHFRTSVLIVGLGAWESTSNNTSVYSDGLLAMTWKERNWYMAQLSTHAYFLFRSSRKIYTCLVRREQMAIASVFFGRRLSLLLLNCAILCLFLVCHRKNWSFFEETEYEVLFFRKQSTCTRGNYTS